MAAFAGENQETQPQTTPIRGIPHASASQCRNAGVSSLQIGFDARQSMFMETKIRRETKKRYAVKTLADDHPSRIYIQTIKACTKLSDGIAPKRKSDDLRIEAANRPRRSILSVLLYEVLRTGICGYFEASPIQYSKSIRRQPGHGPAHRLRCRPDSSPESHNNALYTSSTR